MRFKLAVLVSIVLVTSGCSQSLPDNASEGFEKLAENREDSDYHVGYNISIESSFEDTGTELDLYSYDGVTKIVGEPISSYSTGLHAVYYHDNETVSCSETRGIVSCNPRSSQELFDLAFNAKFEDLNYSGSDSFAGRECQRFDGVPNTSLINPSEYENLESTVCLDKELGFASHLEINISDEYTNATVTLEAEEFDRDVEEGNVELPKSLILSASCTTDASVSVTPLEDLDSLTLSVNGENRSLDVGERFEEKEFEINESNLEEGTNEIKAYDGSSSTETSCYYFNYSGSTDYDYDNDYDYDYSYGEADTSDLNLSDYNILEGRIANGDFSEVESEGGFSIENWEHTDGNTHEISSKSLLDGESVGTSWESNGADIDPASISQEVNLTEVEAIGLDAAGGGGNPERSKIVLEIDGEQVGEFIKSPQRNEEYTDLGVGLEQDYEGLHTVTVKWVHVSGDNLGNSAIDNVRAYS